MAVETLDDLFEYQLQSIYYVETELADALDELQTSATNGQLVEAFAAHRDETKRHVERLEEVFAALGVPAETRNVPSVDGLREESGRSTRRPATRTFRTSSTRRPDERPSSWR